MQIATKNNGVLAFAYGEEYQKMAYCMAVTAKKNLGLGSTVVVDELKFKDLESVCSVVVGPKTAQKFEVEKYAFRYSPYDVTFKVDADVLFPRATELYHAPHLPVSSGVACDVFGAPTTCLDYRLRETLMGLPTIYSALFSFDKSPATEKFFDLLEYLWSNWYSLGIWNYCSPMTPTTDTVYSLACFQCFGPSAIPGNHFIHMKPGINHWEADSWTQERRFTVDSSGRMFVDGVQLTKTFHYYDKSLIDGQFIRRITDVCNS